MSEKQKNGQRTLLAELVVIDRIVGNKVQLFAGAEFKEYRIASWSSLANKPNNFKFDPLMYVVKTGQSFYTDCIEDSTLSERREYQIKEFHKKSDIVVGDMVHLFSKDGIYTITKFEGNTAVITCRSWQYREADKRHQYISVLDIKCKKGEGLIGRIL